MAESILRVRSLSGESVGNAWSGSSTMHVGRTPGLPLFIDDKSVSRWHAELALTSGGWAVRDMGSRNGSCINGQPLGTDGHRVQAGDILQFGNATLVVETAYVASENRGPGHGDYQVEKKLLLNWDDLADLESQLSTRFPKGCLTLLMRTGRHVREMKTSHDCLQSILWSAAEFFEAEHAAILTVGEDASPLALRESLHLGPAVKPDWFVSHPFVLEAFSVGKSILGRDSAGRSALALLLRTDRDNRLGILLLVRNDAERRYQESNLILADALALAVSVSIQTYIQSFHRFQGMCTSIFDVLTKIANWQNPGAREEHQRVSQIAALLATELRLSAQDINSLRLAIPLRNIGVLGIKKDLLNKKGALSEIEKAHVREQILRGIETLEGAPWMSSLIPIVRNCKERWDGGGYPDGLAGDAVPLLARIVAVADALSAMMEDRPYRKALSLDVALGEIRANRGTQFDPALADLLVRIKPKLNAALVTHLDTIRTMSHEDVQKLVASCRPQRPGHGKLAETLDDINLTDAPA